MPGMPPMGGRKPAGTGRGAQAGQHAEGKRETGRHPLQTRGARGSALHAPFPPFPHAVQALQHPRSCSPCIACCPSWPPAGCMPPTAVAMPARLVGLGDATCSANGGGVPYGSCCCCCCCDLRGVLKPPEAVLARGCCVPGCCMLGCCMPGIGGRSPPGCCCSGMPPSGRGAKPPGPGIPGCCGPAVMPGTGSRMPGTGAAAGGRTAPGGGAAAAGGGTPPGIVPGTPAGRCCCCWKAEGAAGRAAKPLVPGGPAGRGMPWPGAATGSPAGRTPIGGMPGCGAGIGAPPSFICCIWPASGATPPGGRGVGGPLADFGAAP